MRPLKTDRYGIALLSVIPLRETASHRSQMVSQLLFGETYRLLRPDQADDESAEFIEIECRFDGYQGWLARNQFSELIKPDFNKDKLYNFKKTTDFLFESSQQPISIGSELTHFSHRSKWVKPPFDHRREQFHELVQTWLDVPYLWGGRSLFGVDCSGLTQVVYRLMKCPLPRDAYEQAECGSAVETFDETKAGDLAFFRNETGRIFHVGIVMGDGTITHASGRVRCDRIDERGIFDRDRQTYSHRRPLYRRVLPENF